MFPVSTKVQLLIARTINNPGTRLFSGRYCREHLERSRPGSSATVGSSCRVENMVNTRCHFSVFSKLRTKQQDPTMNIFDRKAKTLQRNRAASSKDSYLYDYVKEEVGFRMSDRIYDIKRKFDVAVDLGCGKGYISKNLTDDVIGLLFNCDLSTEMLRHVTPHETIRTQQVTVDEEFFPFKNVSLDLVISSLSLHWVNDLPGTFKQIHNALKNDGVLLGAMFGGDTLFELRCSLQMAEIEREGGFGVHVSPFTALQDVGHLLNRAGFTMLTVDVDEIKVNYPSIKELVHDLKGMGENNCSWNRKPHLRRDTLEAAGKIMKDMYGNPDGTVPCTYQIINFIGWKPDPSQQKPAERGSANISFKDLPNLTSMPPT